MAMKTPSYRPPAITLDAQLMLATRTEELLPGGGA
jgi:hypothetical protein